MLMNVSAIVSEVLAANRGPDTSSPGNRVQPDYGIEADLENDLLAMKMTFRSDEAYCCMEWGCHLALHDGKRWDALRTVLEDHGVPTPSQLRLKLTCVVKSGSLFFDMSRPDPTRRGWYAFRVPKQMSMKFLVLRLRSTVSRIDRLGQRNSNVKRKKADVMSAFC